MANVKFFSLSLAAWVALSLIPVQAKAGGCFSTTQDGKCVKWDQTKDIIWNFDAGPLKGPAEEANPSNPNGAGGKSGCQVAKQLDVSNADGVAMIERSFQRWMDVPNSHLVIKKGTALLNGEDVNFTNIEKVYSGGFIWPTQTPSQVDASGCYDSDPNTPCLNPIIFDHSGLITDAINGQCAHCSILGFAAILPKTASDPPQNTIQDPVNASGQAVVSGACLEPRVIDPICGDCCPQGITIDNIEGTMTHELGHFLGLDHTLVNKESYIDCNGPSGCSPSELEEIPTMIGFFVKGMDFKTLTKDDQATFASLYPGPNFSTATCSITGIARTSLGAHQRCLEVVARKTTATERNNAVGTIAGAFAKRNSQGIPNTNNRTDPNGKNVANCAEATGDECARYTINGLEPGTYHMEVHDFDALAPGKGDGSNLGFVLEPCTPDFAGANLKDQNGNEIPGSGYPEANGMNDNLDAATVVCAPGPAATVDVKMQ